MKANQYVLFKGSGTLHCMEVYTDNDTTDYVIDYAEGFTATRNDLVFVTYDRQKEVWIETSRVARS